MDSRSAAGTPSHAQWERAIQVVSNMLDARGFDTVHEAEQVHSDDVHAGWWLSATHSGMDVDDAERGELRGTARQALGLHECCVRFLPSTGCVGKSAVLKLLEEFGDRVSSKYADMPGSRMLVHSSRLSSDANAIMREAQVQVFSVSEVQFDRLQLLNDQGILKELSVAQASDEDAGLRRWLTSDPMALYFCLQEDMVVHWTTGEERRRAIVVPEPPFNT